MARDECSEDKIKLIGPIILDLQSLNEQEMQRAKDIIFGMKIVKELQQLNKEREKMDNLKLIENGLIKVYKIDIGEYVVDGRELWQGLEVKTDFSTWIKRRFKECDAVENEDYSSFLKNGEREIGGTTIKEYIIKLDTTKEMAMLERNDIGKQYRRYFIEIEKKYRKGETAKVESDTTKEKLAEAKLKNAKVREANIFLKIAERIDIPAYQQIMYSKATEVLAGEAVLPLPKVERKTYSATEIGEQLTHGNSIYFFSKKK